MSCLLITMLMKICIMCKSRSCHVISCRLIVVYCSAVYETPIIGCYNSYMFMFSLFLWYCLVLYSGSESVMVLFLFVYVCVVVRIPIIKRGNFEISLTSLNPQHILSTNQDLDFNSHISWYVFAQWLRWDVVFDISYSLY